MGKRGKKPRRNLDSRQFESTEMKIKKEDRDWTFEDIARSKTRRR